VIQPQSQCTACARYRSPASRENTRNLDGPFCAAFPDGIPDDVYEMRVDHRLPIDGDNGLQWVARDGAEYPENALATPDQ